MTVAVCTRNRTALLERALDSLVAQRPAVAAVVVVDNAPDSDATRRLLAERYPQFTYVREPVLGLDFARNRALRESPHDIVAFLDDDAVAVKDWASQLCETLTQNPGVGLCTGHTGALSRDTEAERLFERNGGFGRGDTLIRLPRDRRKRMHGLPVPLIIWAISVGNGANFAVRRSTALALGGFDEAFELGEALHGGGDLDLFWRILTAGHELVYQPSAKVLHQHRTQVPAVARQLAEHQRALVAFLVKSLRTSDGKHRLSLGLVIGWRLVKPMTRMVKRCVGRDPLPLPMLWTMWRHTLGGLTIYPVALRIAEQRRRDGGLAT